MTDSESDVGIIHIRNRLLELIYSSEAVLSVDQIARILGVDESRILHELNRDHNDLVYDQTESTVRVRRHAERSLTDVEHNNPTRTSNAAVVANYGSDGYYRYRGRVVASRGALRKPKYRRPIGKDAEEIDGGESGAPKGRVGYVCVADEFRLSALEAYYRAQGYYTKFDFDVLHIRFSDKEMNAKDTRSFPASAAHGRRIADNISSSYGGNHNINNQGSGNNSNNSNHGGNPATNSVNNNNTGGEKPSDHTGSRTTASSNKHPRKAGFDLFVFEYGAIVWWGFDQRFFKIVENDFMLPNSPIARYMVNRYMTQLVNENYPVWCTYTLVRKETLEPDEHFKERLRFDHFLIPFGRGDLDTSNVSMLCASHALAQSAKIDYLELKVQELTESCSPLPRELREKGHATITERRLLQLRGEVLSYRLMLKSGSNLMDEPDFFWENAYLKPVFQATKECFEIAERVEALDNKLDAANEILSMLAEEFSQRHGARLEWIVIWLVFVEVVIGVLELLIDIKPWLYMGNRN